MRITDRNKRFKFDIKELEKAYTKELGRDTNPYPYEVYSIFPLSQFKVKNPCKKCIVRACCSQECENSIKHNRLKQYIRTINFKNFILRFLYIIWFLYFVFTIFYITLLGR